MNPPHTPETLFTPAVIEQKEIANIKMNKIFCAVTAHTRTQGKVADEKVLV